MKLNNILGFIFFGISLNINAGEIARGNIDEMYNSLSGQNAFGILMSATSLGPCAGRWVKIQEANFPNNIESYKFAFSMAMTAIATGKKIRIHNYSSDSCDGATFIGLYK